MGSYSGGVRAFEKNPDEVDGIAGVINAYLVALLDQFDQSVARLLE